MRFKTHVGTGTPENPARLPEQVYRDNETRIRAVDRALTLDDMMRIMRGLQRFGDDSDDMHTHVCGFDLDNHGRKGCGHVWRHGDEVRDAPTVEEFRAAHNCPNCGRTKWNWKLAPDSPLVLEAERETSVREGEAA